MKRITFYAALATACGDDDGSDATAGETHAETSSSGGSATSPETSRGVDTSTAAESTSGSTEGSSTDASTSSNATTTGDESSSTGGPGDGCLPPEIFVAIDQHAHDLVASADLLATHPSENEVTGFLSAPGLPEPPALAASFAGPLVMTCSDPLLYDEFCEEGRCSQIECTGRGPGWINHVWVEPALAGEWTFEEVHVHLRWSGGTGTAFDITTTSTAPGGVDVSLTGEGTMDVDAMSVIETFPAMHDAGPTVLEYADDAAGFSGQLTIADVVVADVDVAGHLVPTGDCP